MKQPNTNTIYTAALYLRLSKDDGLMDKDSASIDTQRDMLTSYCSENNIIIHDFYIDDGFTGLNTERPGFRRMIEDVEAKKVNCVITKDQSRLGRNYLESDFYMEVYFPNTVFATSPSMITLIFSTLLLLTLPRSEICVMICIRRISPKR